MYNTAFKEKIMDIMDQVEWPEDWLHPTSPDVWYRRIVEWAAGVSPRTSDFTISNRFLLIIAMALMALSQSTYDGAYNKYYETPLVPKLNLVPHTESDPQ